jgi:hypothetical protein
MAAAALVYADLCVSNKEDPLAVLARGRPDLFSTCTHLRCDRKCAPKFHDQRNNKALTPCEVYDIADPTFRPKVVADFFARVAAGPPGPPLPRPLNCIQVDLDPSSKLQDIVLWYSLPAQVQAAAPLAITGCADLTLPEWLRDARVPRDALLLQWVVQSLDAAEVQARLQATRPDFLARVIHMTSCTDSDPWFGVYAVPDRDEDFVADWQARVHPEWQTRVPLLESREGDQHVDATPAMWVCGHKFHCLDLSVADMFTLPRLEEVDFLGPAKVFSEPAAGPVWVPRKHSRPRPQDGAIVSISGMCISTWPCIHVCKFESGKAFELDGVQVLRQLNAQGGKDSWPEFWTRHFAQYRKRAEAPATP